MVAFPSPEKIPDMADSFSTRAFQDYAQHLIDK